MMNRSVVLTIVGAVAALAVALWLSRADAARRNRAAQRAVQESATESAPPPSDDSDAGPPSPDRGRNEDGDTDSAEGVREDIYQLTLHVDEAYEAFKRDRLVNRWRNGSWAHKLAGARAESSARFRRSRLFEFIEHPDRFSLLMAEDDLVPGGWKQFYTSVLSAFHDKAVSLEHKWLVGRTYLAGLGLETPTDVAGIRDLAELYLHVDLYGRSTAEAREVGRLLGDGYSERQATRVAIALRGLATGQWRLTELRAWSGETDLTAHERHLVERAIEDVTARKRQALAEILTPGQLNRLYGAGRYDNDEYWRERLAATPK